jgi:hypothetical protein
MEFTQTEAEKKTEDRQWVCTRDEWFEEEGVPFGTRGQVIGADPLGGVDRATNQDIWVVHVRFPSEGVLILNIGLGRYIESFVEIAVDKR